MPLLNKLGFPGGSVVKNLPASTGDVVSIHESGRSPGKGNGNPLVFLCGRSHEQRSLVDYSTWGCKRVGYDFVTKQKFDELI